MRAGRGGRQETACDSRHCQWQGCKTEMGTMEIGPRAVVTSMMLPLVAAAISLDRMVAIVRMMGIAVGFFVGHVGEHKTDRQHKNQSGYADGCLEVLVIFHD